MPTIESNRYSPLLDAGLRKTLVTMDEGEAPVFNTRYEGSPASGAVRIPVRSTEIAPALYNGTDGMSASVTAGAFVTVDSFKQYAVNELIDGYEAAAAPDDLIANRLDSAAYGAALLLDTDAAETLTAEGTVLPESTALTVSSIFGIIVSMAAALSKKNVPMAGRWLLVNPDAFSVLLQCSDFVKASDAGQAMLSEGAVGKICGFTVRVSNNLVPGVAMIAGHGNWCCRVREWVVEPHLVDLDASDKYVGACAVKGRWVFAHKVTKAGVVLNRRQAQAMTVVSAAGAAGKTVITVEDADARLSFKYKLASSAVTLPDFDASTFAGWTDLPADGIVTAGTSTHIGVAALYDGKMIGGGTATLNVGA